MSNNGEEGAHLEQLIVEFYSIHYKSKAAGRLEPDEVFESPRTLTCCRGVCNRVVPLWFGFCLMVFVVCGMVRLWRLAT